MPAIITLLKSTIVGSLATNCSRSGEINFILAPEHFGLLSYASPLDWRPELRPDPTLGRSRQKNRLKNTASNCAKSGLINSPDDLMLFERADERVKLVHGQIPRPKLSPMCRVPGNNYAETSTQHSAASDQWALSGVRLSTRLGTRARKKVGPAGRHTSSFITLRFCVVAWQERRLAMLPNVILLVFAALASSLLWWRSRFKICRRCRSRIRRLASVCHVCGAEQ